MVTYSGFESTAQITISQRDLLSIINWGLNCKDEKLEFDRIDKVILSDLISAFNDTTNAKLDYKTRKIKQMKRIDFKEFNQEQNKKFRDCECGCTHSNHSMKHPNRCLICGCKYYNPLLITSQQEGNDK